MKFSNVRLVRVLLAMMLIPVAMSAQDMTSPLPLDPEVRYGKLDNGLTYYIRHNEYPKGEADFYIAQKVGSILEEDNQRGLAHFLEHMCFNGTENFPGNNIIDWCESVGIKFGHNLNAYTSVDKTVYNISNVPVARTGVQDTCLLILHDWADGLLLDPTEIDKERGVIHQEWRRSNVGQMRILENLLPTIYPNSRYGYRLPIGTMEVVDNFAPQALRDYYEAWYRPDQQGIVVVGDIDVDYIEGKIKELFSPIKMPENAKPREYFPVADYTKPVFAIGHDKEMPYSIVQMSFLSDPLPDEQKNTMIFYIQQYMESMIAEMLNQRLEDLSRDPNCVFSAGSVSFGNYMLSRTKDALTLTGVAKGDAIEPVLESVYRELLRAIKGGFTQSEYELARNEFLSNIEKQYNNRNTQENSVYVNEYVDNFTENTPAPGIETDYQLFNMIAQMIPVEAINQALPEMLSDVNYSVIAMTPEKDGMQYPTEESLAGVIAKVNGENIEAFVDNVKTEPLIPALPTPGSITKTTELPMWGATEYTLSNGVRVIVKQTKFKDDEIDFVAAANGGTSVYPDALANELVFMPAALEQLSLGDYKNSDLTKYLKGKNVSLSPSFDAYTRTFTGSSTPADLKYLMELIYMHFTAANLDEQEFDGYKSALTGILKNMELNPDYIFQKNISEILYNGSPRMAQLSVGIINSADREKIVNMTKELTANAADYTFIFVGNVDTEVLKPLLCQYIATLPADVKTAQTGTPKYIEQTQMKGGKGVDTFTTKMETPQTTVYIEEWGVMPYDIKNRVLSSVAGQILTNRLLENVREKEGAVYSIGAQGTMFRLDPQNTVLLSYFPMTPDKKDLVLGLVEKEFANMGTTIAPEELKKVQEFMVKKQAADLETNKYWLNNIAGFQRNGVDLIADYSTVVNSLTPEDVAAFMKALNEQGNYRVIVMDPEQ